MRIGSGVAHDTSKSACVMNVFHHFAFIVALCANAGKKVAISPNADAAEHVWIDSHIDAKLLSKRSHALFDFLERCCAVLRRVTSSKEVVIRAVQEQICGFVFRLQMTVVRIDLA